MNNFAEQSLLRLLIILTPFHFMIFTILLKDYGFLKYWKETVIIIACVIIFTKKLITIITRNQMKLNLIDISMIYFMITMLLSYLVLTNDKVDGLYMLRVYIQPVLVYFIVRNIYFSESQYNTLTKIIFNTAIILSIYGLFQALVLGDQFLINLGYPTKYAGRLLDSFYISGFGNFQRVVSTFVNTNVFALYLSFSLILVFINNNIFTKRKLIVGIIIILLAILFSFSRSTWIPLFLVLIIIMRHLKKTFPSLRKFMLILPILSVGILSLFSVILDLKIFEKLYLFFYRSITLRDTSVAGRSDIWNEAFNIVKENIFGIGMGQTGAKAIALGNNVIPAESSYLTILLDFGIQGFVPFLIIFFSAIYISLKNIKKFDHNKKLKLINIGSLLATIMILISMIFSNYIHDIELFTLYYVILGLRSNQSLYQNLITNENI